MSSQDRVVLCWYTVLLCIHAIFSQRIPKFTTLPKDGTTVLLNEDAILQCSSTGSPLPKIVNWLINDRPVNFDTHFLRLDGSLRIPRVQKSNAGDYQCVAHNSQGGIASEKKRFIVAYFEPLPLPQIESFTLRRNSHYSISPPIVDCQPKPVYIWKKNGIVIIESSRVKVTPNGQLFLSDLQDGDAGLYKLTIENTFLKNIYHDKASQDAKNVQIKIYGEDYLKKLQIIHISKNQTAGEGKTPKVTLECFISGRPPGRVVKILWNKVDAFGEVREVPNSEKYIRLLNSQRLEINKPTYDDDHGKYQCIAFADQDIQDTKFIHLTVFAPPLFLLKPSDTIGYTDNSTSLNCTSAMEPSRVQRWYRNGIPVKPDSRTIVHPNNTLSILSLNWEDNGIFQCGAENYAALSFAQVEMKVQNISARIDTVFRDIYIGVGSRVEVPCVAVGAPKPQVYWLRNDTRLKVPSQQHSILKNGSLIINSMQDKDNGYYTCVADNLINIESKQAKVWVVVPTRIVKGPQPETYARKGENVRLPCDVEYDHQINYTREWRYNNLPVSNERYVVQWDGALIVRYAQEVDNGRDFACHVFSYGGNQTVRTILLLVQLPMEPSSPRASDIHAYGMTLTWDAPASGGSVLTGYDLYMRNFTMEQFVLLVKLPAVNYYMVTNLRAGSKYKFQVSAKNKFGTGDRSAETAWLETQTLSPSEAPYNFRTVAIGKDSITLSWEAPRKESHNGDLLGYYIAYRLSGYNLDFTNINVKGGNALTYKMTGLPIFTRYEIKIAAYNKAGGGVWSTVLLVDTMQGIPSVAPTNVSVSTLNDTSVRVSFKSPPQQYWNGKLTKIIAKTWPPLRPQDQTVTEVAYDSSFLYYQTFILRGLKADTEYTLAVAVATTGGSSPGSDWVQFRTSEGMPDAVRDLQVSGIYSDAFTVSWKPPKETAGRLKGYKVKYRLFNVGRDWKIMDELPTAKGSVISNLLPRTRYEVSVAAYTAVAVGTFMSASVTTIESPELPSAPSNLKAYAIWGTNISLGFTPGNSGRAVILYYHIEYNNETYYRRNPQAAIWRVIKNLTKILENPVNITHLKPSTTYRFRMKAFNRVGPSPISNVSEDITTSEGIPSKAPSNIYAEAPQRETLLIRWTPPPADTWNSGSVKYEFLIKPKDVGIVRYPLEKPPPTIQLFDTQATSYYAHGLQKYTMYNITMRLFNDKGHSPWSPPIFARTSEDYPAGAPTNVKVRVIDSSSVFVAWGPVSKSQQNGVILGYKVYYQMQGVRDTELWKDFPSATTFNGRITGLYGYTNYEFSLLAYTRVGGTVKGNVVVVRTDEGTPGKPKDVVFNEITFDYTILQWNIPTHPNGIIIGYEVKYRKNITGSMWIIHKETIQPFKRVAKVYGLVYNSNYLFEIRGRTATGWGEAAKEIVLITSERYIPDSPIILTIPLTSVYTKSIFMTWRPRYDGNSPIRSYNIEYNEEYTGWQRYKFGIPPVDNIDPSLTELEIMKLLPGNSYQFRIRANNDLGSSEWSEKSETRKTNSEVQVGAPVNSRVIRKSPTTMLIAWEPPKGELRGSKLRAYKIKYKLVGGIRDYIEESVPSTKKEKMLSNLRIFEQYEVGIGAFNSKGQGIWTPMYHWRTGESRPLNAPTNVRYYIQGGNKIRITWTAPLLETVQGYTLGFKVESARHILSRRKRRSLIPVCPDIPVVQTHLAGPDSNEITLKNLQKFSRYSVTVRVFNNFGDGPKSQMIWFNTPKAVPGPPYILSSRVYRNQIDVDFGPPCHPNGKVTRYKAVLRENIGGNVLPAKYYAHPRRIKFDKLSSSTSYTFELSAQSSSGYGQKASIEFSTKWNSGAPKAPDAPLIYDNRPGILVLQWGMGDTGNLPIDRFFLEYRTANGNWLPFRTIISDEMRFDGTMVVYQIIGLTRDTTYRFRVKSQNSLGVSPFSPSSKLIKTATLASSVPIYREIWFIFLLVIIFLLIVIIVAVCCYRCKHKETKYKPTDPSYNFSSFEMAMVNQTDDESGRQLLPDSHGASIASSKRTGKFNDSASIMKSSDNDADKSSDTEEEMKRRDRKLRDESIANHYSNDPVHKTWQDSIDKKTKKQIIDQLDRKLNSKENLNSPPNDLGRRDISKQRDLARSEPSLVEPEESKYVSPIRRPQQRRPNKNPINQELTRSQPDLNYNSPQSDAQVTRQPSFLRATGTGDSDSESFQDVFEKEKTKREIVMDLESRMPNYYPNTAPPPYDYHGAPPAYTPSETDEYNDVDLRNGLYNKPLFNKSNVYSDHSDDYSDNGRSNYQPKNRFPRDYPPPKKDNPSSRARNYPQYNVRPERNSAPIPQYIPPGRFSPPAISTVGDDYEDDFEDDYPADMTLV